MQQIGKYRILEKIGEGGFGVVYRGFDPVIKRSVAIKTCTWQDAASRQRFVHEAQIAGGLQHRNITTVFDFGLHDGLPFLVQEYLSGDDLDDLIQRGEPGRLSDKLAILEQVARGLEYAHRRGVVHRDIKPSNVRVLDDGTAKIMDFGIARLGTEESGLTQSGMTLGTAAYLAPEQIRGEPLDGRTDLFALGVLAYELLTRGRPFQGPHLSAVIYQILHRDPPPITLPAEDCPAPLERVLLRLMAKEPRARYRDAGDLLRDLGPCLAEAKRRDRSPKRLATSPPGPSPVEEASPAAPTLTESERRPPAEVGAAQQTRTWLPWTVFAVSLGVLLLVGSWTLHQIRPAATDASVAAIEPIEVGPAETPAGPAEASPPVALPEAAAGPATAVLRLETGEPGTVAWIGERSLNLGALESVEIPAGEPVTIVFELVEGSHRERGEVTVEVAPGETLTVASPLARLATLSVQPELGTPLGYVFLDGRLLGSGPLRNLRLGRGSHALRVAASPDAEAGLSLPLQLLPGVHQVVTFDLDRGTIEARQATAGRVTGE